MAILTAYSNLKYVNIITLDMTINSAFSNQVFWRPVACYRIGHLVVLNAYIQNNNAIRSTGTIIGTITKYKPDRIAYAITGLGTVIRFETNGNIIVDTTNMPMGNNLFQLLYYSKDI